MSVAVKFGLGVTGGLAANIGLMKLNAQHKGCANVCTLCQFLFGFSQSFASPAKRALLLGRTKLQLPIKIHVLFALMFFMGPFLGNLSTTFTNQDFYPVFLVVRSCGSVSSMILGYLFAGKTYSLQQILGVLLITVGAGVTTVGCCYGSQASKSSLEAEAATPPRLFLLGVGCCVLNLLNDSGLGVLQSKIFAPYLVKASKAKASAAAANKQATTAAMAVNDEAMVVMSAAGTVIMAAVAGREVLGFLTLWVMNPTWTPTLTPLPVQFPYEIGLLVVNFYGNWNAKLICTWLNAHATAVLSALVPMLYRLISTVVSANLAKGVVLPVYTWLGVGFVFAGSSFYLLAPAQAPRGTEKKSD
mmetsp:Transcript_73955/g.144551  ORF Transcript_73955/g.144551 Transcript_73955/m.144551 type:complete len:359 (-) Transcript_73955:280-1356(-)